MGDNPHAEAPIEAIVMQLACEYKGDEGIFYAFEEEGYYTIRVGFRGMGVNFVSGPTPYHHRQPFAVIDTLLAHEATRGFTSNWKKVLEYFTHSGTFKSPTKSGELGKWWHPKTHRAYDAI